MFDTAAPPEEHRGPSREQRGLAVAHLHVLGPVAPLLMEEGPDLAKSSQSMAAHCLFQVRRSLMNGRAHSKVGNAQWLVMLSNMGTKCAVIPSIETRNHSKIIHESVMSTWRDRIGNSEKHPNSLASRRIGLLAYFGDQLSIQ
jgi:hypothetical protein